MAESNRKNKEGLGNEDQGTLRILMYHVVVCVRHPASTMDTYTHTSTNQKIRNKQTMTQQDDLVGRYIEAIQNRYTTNTWLTPH